jgi:hypothetical protein
LQGLLRTKALFLGFEGSGTGHRKDNGFPKAWAKAIGIAKTRNSGNMATANHFTNLWIEFTIALPLENYLRRRQIYFKYF